jgi:hypothetical protein
MSEASNCDYDETQQLEGPKPAPSRVAKWRLGGRRGSYREAIVGFWYPFHPGMAWLDGTFVIDCMADDHSQVRGEVHSSLFQEAPDVGCSFSDDHRDLWLTTVAFRS